MSTADLVCIEQTRRLIYAVRDGRATLEPKELTVTELVGS